ncbi:MAG: 3-oxoacyl-[acyl-carrier-protein] reductase [Gemmatales bacterium]|nr:3-oxoacyl-[acyl-carrier-protein] reductase [Gemmatales bacterium]MDW7993021.1 3-oxoacyl-[acyl-carrier-protein] reductase [Gemmatales bacterium]
MRLKGKVAIVTGASRGIGRAIAEIFATEGAQVAVVYRGQREAAESVVQGILQRGGQAKAYQVDVSDWAAVKNCVELVLADWGQIDILVNNAGIIQDGLFLQMEPEAWYRVMQTNLNGTFHFTRAVVEPMFRRRQGRIINISSVAAERVNRGQTNYAASKGAINAFTRALAVELASRNITVNAIAPGFIETDMTQAVRNVAGEQLQKAIPMRRLGKPEDVAKVALFLASDDSGYITGQVITVDGGLSLGGISA